MEKNGDTTFQDLKGETTNTFKQKESHHYVPDYKNIKHILPKPGGG